MTVGSALTAARLPALVALVLVRVVAPAAAQVAVSQGRAAVIAYQVAADKTTEFDDVLATLVRRLNDPQPDTPHPPIALKVFRSTAPREGWVRYVLFVDPASQAVDYSLERLITRVLPEQAEALSKMLSAATRERPPVMEDLDLVHTVTPADPLRRRLESYLATQLATGGAPTQPDRPDTRLEDLRGTAWQVEGLEVRTSERDNAQWTFEWTCSVRNTSLHADLAADVAVEFRDAAGTVLATAHAFEAIPVQEIRTVSGRVRVAAAAAERVAATTIKITPR